MSEEQKETKPVEIPEDVSAAGLAQKFQEAEVQMRVESEAQRLAKIMFAEARRVVAHEDATKRINEMAEAKYDVECEIVERLTSFMYLLMRDHLIVGVINELTKEALKAEEVMYSDEILRMKAESMSKMIARGSYMVRDFAGKYWLPGGEGDPNCDDQE